MPRIQDWILKCIFYLYPSFEAADKSARGGGTGFFVSVPVEPGQPRTMSLAYCVTAAHLIEEGNLFLRVNTRDGRFDIIETQASDWTHDPRGSDSAIMMGGPTPETHEMEHIPSTIFLTRDMLRSYKVGPGDEVYFVGRFVNYDGRGKNTPSVRFGNISMLPEERVKVRGIRAQESYLVEARSIPGYSGSPVFVYRTPLAPRPKGFRPLPTTYLLGIDWSHLHDHHKVVRYDEKSRNYVAVTEDLWARQNTMMMGVIPAYILNDFLISPEESGRREKAVAKERAVEETRARATCDAATSEGPSPG